MFQMFKLKNEYIATRWMNENTADSLFFKWPIKCKYSITLITHRFIASTQTNTTDETLNTCEYYFGFRQTKVYEL